MKREGVRLVERKRVRGLDLHTLGTNCWFWNWHMVVVAVCRAAADDPVAALPPALGEPFPSFALLKYMRRSAVVDDDDVDAVVVGPSVSELLECTGGLCVRASPRPGFAAFMEVVDAALT